MSVVLQVEAVSKRYRLGVISHRRLARDLESWWARVRGREDPNSCVIDPRRGRTTGQDGDEFWALRDITFDVRDGETVGIIGRNGAGKSTLLRILSNITSPTTGAVRIKGRIASLLEVGTGFHPELTGRENVYLNGAILGLTRRDTAARFDSIAEFSGVTEFLDTPVKRYSSGMRVRLAFAVAAHLDPDILIIDEVLAVGDAAFQHKCLGKLGQAAREGRTVLFVSHDMAAVEALCRRGVVLEEGRVVFEGSQSEAVRTYLDAAIPQGSDLSARDDRRGSGEIRVKAVEFFTEGRPAAALQAGADAEVHLAFERDGNVDFPQLNVSITVCNQLDTPIFHQSNTLSNTEFGALPRRGTFVCHIPRLPLPPTKYRVHYSIRAQSKIKEAIDELDAAAEFSVVGGDFFGGGRLPPPRSGVCLVDARWEVRG
jgi:lipopolysaccharide transport system ATP-binding protein